jgi:hypothetical protein
MKIISAITNAISHPNAIAGNATLAGVSGFALWVGILTPYITLATLVIGLAAAIIGLVIKIKQLRKS